MEARPVNAWPGFCFCKIDMRPVKTVFIALAAVLLAGCTREVLQPEGPIATVAGGKIVNTKGPDFKNDVLLVKFASVPDEAQLAALMHDGVVSVERALPSTPGKEEMEARFGLDRWYCVNLAEDANASGLAESFAGIEAVGAVQYSMNYNKASDCKTYPWRPSGETAALAPAAVSAGFNDPLLRDQWHYSNGGATTIANSAYRVRRRSRQRRKRPRGRHSRLEFRRRRPDYLGQAG